MLVETWTCILPLPITYHETEVEAGRVDGGRTCFCLLLPATPYHYPERRDIELPDHA